MNYELLAEIWQSHSGKITGLVIGMLVGIFILTFGFFHTIFVMLCMIAGYIIGKKIDEKADIMEILGKYYRQGITVNRLYTKNRVIFRKEENYES